MNDINALIFSAIGSLMGILPILFPSHFPPSGADSASARALWLDVMGVVQLALGAGFLLRMHVVPVVARILTTARSGEAGSLALPNPRTVSSR